MIIWEEKFERNLWKKHGHIYSFFIRLLCYATNPSQSYYNSLQFLLSAMNWNPGVPFHLNRRFVVQPLGVVTLSISCSGWLPFCNNNSAAPFTSLCSNKACYWCTKTNFDTALYVGTYITHCISSAACTSCSCCRPLIIFYHGNLAYRFKPLFRCICASVALA